MKTRYILLAFAALAMSACARNVEPTEPEGIQMTFTAYQEGHDATKSTVQNGGTQVYWEPGDEIKVFFNGSSGRFTSQNTENATSATFTGTLPVVVGGNEGAGITTKTWGLYPYRADAALDGDAMVTTLPAAQTGRAGSFAKNTNITLAHSEGYGLAFYNVCGGLRFSLTQEGVKEVVFQGQNDEDIAGKVKLAFVDGVPSVQEIIEGQKSITLTAPGGGTFQTGQWYYIVALPGSLSNGFKMTFNTDTQYATLKSSGAKTIKRGIFGSLTDADEDLIFKDKEGGDEPNPEDLIQFKDLSAKYACVEKYDTDGDGAVSIEEAEAADSFNGLFTNWKGVVSFDEISYFKNVHSIDGVFNGCNKLVSITIPENITRLGNDAFNGCSSLISVSLPSSLTEIWSGAFQGCSSLSAIEIPSAVRLLGSRVFYGCIALTSIVLPCGIPSIGESAFYGCVNLSSADIPSSVKFIGDQAFYNCSSLSAIDLPASMTSIGKSAFYGCSLTQISIPSGITSIPNECFYGCPLYSINIPEGVNSIGNKAFDNQYSSSGIRYWRWKVELPSSITNIGTNAFGKTSCIILSSTSPINISSNSFLQFTQLFVPSGLLELYSVRTNWSEYSANLHPMDTFKEKNEYIFATSGAVDMGTSVKWAAFNVDASRPEEYGGKYAWGETLTKTDYSWNNYFDIQDMYSEYFTKYTINEGGKTILDPEDDVAYVKSGGDWRMPTSEEFVELQTKCAWEWTTYEDIKGYMVYGISSGNTIFFPTEPVSLGTGDAIFFSFEGTYWSSSLYPRVYPVLDLPLYYQQDYALAGMIHLSLVPEYGYVNYTAGSRCVGNAIRPVCE